MRANGQPPTTKRQRNSKLQVSIRELSRWLYWLKKAQVMGWCGLSSMLLSAALCGCVSKSKAKTQERAAFAAGQQQAMERILLARNSVTMLGPVRNPLVTWAQGLTLAKALLAADYYAKGEPKQIVIVRNGQTIPVDPKQLLAGEDVPLEAGDVVNIR